MPNCNFCNKSGYAMDNGICQSCREKLFWEDITIGSRWLCQGHTMECVRAMLNLKPCICKVVKHEKDKIKRINYTKGIK